jgi:phenylacetate-CoA ligase
MSTSARLRHLLANEATVLNCTPTYALRLAEVAVAEGIDLSGSAVRVVLVAGEPGGSIPATRERIAGAWGARVLDHTGMTEVGSCSFECIEAEGGVHVIESEFIPEVIDSESGLGVVDGEVGELVLTNLGRWGSPLIRYRTGDQVRMTRERCRCGRWFARLDGGILGRTDDMIVIRGNNVFPSTVEGLVREFDQVSEFAIEVDRVSALAELVLKLELVAGADGDAVAKRVATRFRDRFHFSPKVEIVGSGELPRFEMKARRVTMRSKR